MKKIVIASACRTAIGKFGGTLANVPAAELGSIVIKEALNRANVKPEQVDHVYMGCVIQAGLGQNVARQASLKAGLPIETPAVTVNVVCGSGLNCVNMAAQMIEAGDADIVVAGGMENMDMAPFALQKARYGYRMGPNTERACKEFGAIHCVFPAGCAVVAATEVERIAEHHWDELGMPETLWCNKVKEFGPLIVSIDAEGRNLFEENKVVFNERKEAAKQAIYPEVKFIK